MALRFVLGRTFVPHAFLTAGNFLPYPLLKPPSGPLLLSRIFAAGSLEVQVFRGTHNVCYDGFGFPWLCASLAVKYVYVVWGWMGLPDGGTRAMWFVFGMQMCLLVS